MLDIPAGLLLWFSWAGMSHRLLHSSSKKGLAGVSWPHPDEDLVAVERCPRWSDTSGGLKL